MINPDFDHEAYRGAVAALESGHPALAEEMFRLLDDNLEAEISGRDIEARDRQESARITSDPEFGILRGLVCHGLGAACMELDRPEDAYLESERACAYFEKAGPSDPMYARVLLVFALQAGTRGDIDEAADAVMKAMNLLDAAGNLHDPLLTSTLGFLCLCRGEPEKAVEFYEKAVLADPGNTRLGENLAYARRKAGIPPPLLP